MREVADFGHNPGALRMLRHLPEGLPSGAPLVVVLHGCTQRAEAHARDGGWLTLADRYGFAVLAPEQTPANNHNRCFNWYEPGDRVRGEGEAASIRAMVAHMVQEHGLDAGRVFVTGLSAGGAMSAVMLATYPDVFTGGAIVAGLPYAVADNVQEALGAMYGGRARSAAELGTLVRSAGPAGAPVPRVAIWHGDADTTVKPHNATELAKQWSAAHDVPSQPDEKQRLPGRMRSVWRAKGTGEVLIESNLLAGFGHATPLATQGSEGVGSVAPYMLEAGVSSSLETARFWGLATGSATERVEQPSSRTREPEREREPAREQHVGGGVGDDVMATVSQHVPPGVQRVIAQALKAAGLMR